MTMTAAVAKQQEQPKLPKKEKKREPELYYAIYDFTGSNPDELSLTYGDQVMVTAKDDS